MNLRGGMMAEGGAGWGNVGGILGLVDGLLGGRNKFSGNNIVNGLLHSRYFC